jgi:hypothetical protein
MTGRSDPLACVADLRRATAGFVEDFPPRTVHSLYFDTRTLTAFADHVDGLGRRAKVRVRWYGDPLPDKAAVEIKRREGKLTRKSVFALPPGRFDPMDLRGLAELAQVPQAERLGLGFVELVPTAWVSYDRRYFTSRTGVRCTLDFHLRSSWPDRAPMPGSPSRPLTSEVLAEIKAAPARAAAAQEVAGELGWLLTKHSKYVTALSQD